MCTSGSERELDCRELILHMICRALVERGFKAAALAAGVDPHIGHKHGPWLYVEDDGSVNIRCNFVNAP